jgi:hypothetical protein
MQGKALAALDKLELQGNQLRYPHTDIYQKDTQDATDRNQNSIEKTGGTDR